MCLFALTFFYRFASLGGTLGGVEDDEFVTLAYAQRIVLGDVPRDFSVFVRLALEPSGSFGPQARPCFVG